MKKILFTIKFGPKESISIPEDKINEFIKKEKRKFSVLDSKGKPIYVKTFQG